MRRSLIAISMFLAGCLCLARAQDMSLMGVGGNINTGGLIPYAVTVLYNNGAVHTSGSTVATTADSPKNSLLVVICSNESPDSALTGVTTSPANTFMQAAQSTTTSGYYNTAIYYSANLSADFPSGSTITCAASGHSYAIAAFSVNDNNASPLDKNASSTVNSTTVSISTGTLSAAKEAVFATSSWSVGISSFSEASGFTQITGSPTTYNSAGYDVAYKATSSTGSVTYNPSNATTNNIAAAIASFQ